MKKKDKEKSGFGKFIQKVGQAIPDVLGAGIKLATGNVKGAFDEVEDLLKSKADKEEEAALFLQEFRQFKLEWKKEAFELEAKDREGARDMYQKDSMLQKVFAITFLVAYVGLTLYLLSAVLKYTDPPELAKTMITMIWTGTSVKLNTIIDFLFGGSITKDKE